MVAYKRSFLEIAFTANALGFGKFTLKSGRVSPYFFNASAFSSGCQMQALGRCYRDAILDAGISFDSLFGPAYKGIPLATTVGLAFAEMDQDYPVSFNRKEIKDHGEGGLLFGAPISGRVLVIDDVVTAGTAIRESVQLIDDAGAQLSAFCVAVDRQERGQSGSRSALMELSQKLAVTPISIVTLDDILFFAKNDPRVPADSAPKIAAYRAQYGALS
ncbi:orotate phosphoribosyltransferase [Litorivicinus sp.]|jgi:orotate phosphoribosyltransferase|nr:orotate phosphoribosyltransferase [Litorivicinus sp.]|tara:strand:- start:112 stop:762 length:651 start_codon:yes stop_codon:yes gene_type:complete